MKSERMQNLQDAISRMHVGDLSDDDLNLLMTLRRSLDPPTVSVTIRLKDPNSKLPVIKAIRSVLRNPLKQAKEMAEGSRIHIPAAILPKLQAAVSEVGGEAAE